ncbi:MAG TPA: COX15/CtaA family protein [Acidobacteriaceae bacterium]|nr:COX15/CtaA family protein [Acidobacteriaceae bacterium]
MSDPAVAVAPPSASSSAPSRGLRAYAWGVLAYNVAVILWGAAVRATGSGNGCGDHWPLCNGSVFEHHPTVASMIEYAHRATSGVDLVAVIGLLVWTFRGTAKGHLARIAAVASLIFILNEALIGALLVLLGMTANNESPARAAYLSLHLTNTLLMLAAIALTAHFLSRRSGFLRGSVERGGMGASIAGLIAIVVTGVTGSLAALADTLHPATDLRAAFLQDFSGRGDWLVRIRWVHPAAAVLAGLFVLVVMLQGLRTAAHRTIATWVGLLLLAQYALGVADLTLLTPLSMQILHLLGADLVWIALVVLAARLSLRPAAQD